MAERRAPERCGTYQEQNTSAEPYSRRPGTSGGRSAGGYRPNTEENDSRWPDLSGWDEKSSRPGSPEWDKAPENIPGQPSQARKAANTYDQPTQARKATNAYDRPSQAGKAVNAYGQLSQAGKAANTYGQRTQAGKAANAYDQLSEAEEAADAYGRKASGKKAKGNTRGGFGRRGRGAKASRGKNAEKGGETPERGSAPELPGTAKSMEDVSAVIREMRFRKKLLGGVDELDVWRQLERLQREYRSAYEAERERGRALLKERDVQISQLKRQLVLGNYGRGVTNGQK